MTASSSSFSASLPPPSSSSTSSISTLSSTPSRSPTTSSSDSVSSTGNTSVSLPSSAGSPPSEPVVSPTCALFRKMLQDRNRASSSPPSTSPSLDATFTEWSRTHGSPPSLPASYEGQEDVRRQNRLQDWIREHNLQQAKLVQEIRKERNLCKPQNSEYPRNSTPSLPPSAAGSSSSTPASFSVSTLRSTPSKLQATTLMDLAKGSTPLSPVEEQIQACEGLGMRALDPQCCSIPDELIPYAHRVYGNVDHLSKAEIVGFSEGYRNHNVQQQAMFYQKVLRVAVNTLAPEGSAIFVQGFAENKPNFTCKRWVDIYGWDNFRKPECGVSRFAPRWPSPSNNGERLSTSQMVRYYEGLYSDLQNKYNLTKEQLVSRKETCLKQLTSLSIFVNIFSHLDDDRADYAPSIYDSEMVNIFHRIVNDSYCTISGIQKDCESLRNQLTRLDKDLDMVLTRISSALHMQHHESLDIVRVNRENSEDRSQAMLEAVLDSAHQNRFKFISASNDLFNSLALKRLNSSPFILVMLTPPDDLFSTPPSSSVSSSSHRVPTPPSHAAPERIERTEEKTERNRS